MGPFQVQLHGSEVAGPSPENMEGHGLVAIVFTRTRARWNHAVRLTRHRSKVHVAQWQ